MMDSDEKHTASKEVWETAGTSTQPEESEVTSATTWQAKLTYLKWYFTSKQGWLGDYVSPPSTTNPNNH